MDNKEDEYEWILKNTNMNWFLRCRWINLEEDEHESISKKISRSESSSDTFFFVSLMKGSWYGKWFDLEED